MDPLQLNTGLLPPALRALALGLLVETVVPLLNKSGAASPVPPGQGGRGARGEAELWQALRCKCAELSALVVRADDPGEAAAYVLAYLPKHFEYVFEQLGGPKYRPGSGGREAVWQAALGDGRYHVDRGYPFPGSWSW